MSNIIRQKIYVRSCWEMAEIMDKDRCAHVVLGTERDEAGQWITFMACPVSLTRQLRGHESFIATTPGPPSRIMVFPTYRTDEGQPYQCAWAIMKNGKPDHPCGRPTVYFPTEADDRIPRWPLNGWLMPEYAGVCRIHAQALSGVKVTNRKTYGRTRDFQRSRVYRWEDAALPDIHTSSVTLDECRELVHAIWAAHAPDEVSPPQVILWRSKLRSTGNHKKIRLSLDHLNSIVTLHEAAHALLSAAGSNESHGPLFMRLYLELLERYAGETPEPAPNLKVASHDELAAIEGLRGFEIAEKVAA